MSTLNPPPVPQASYQAPNPPAPKGRSGCGCVLMGLAGLAVVGLVICAGCGGFLYWSVQKGFGEMRAELSKNPIVQEHIGEIQNSEIDWAGAMQQQGGGEQTFRMKLKGTKGEGTIVLHQKPGEDPAFTLDLPSGESFPIEIGPKPAATEEDDTLPSDESPQAEESAEEMPVEPQAESPAEENSPADPNAPAPAEAP